MSKHTPGPFKLGRRGLSPAVVDAEGRMIAECPYHQSHRTHYALESEAIANAILFSAATEMLEALIAAEELFVVGILGAEPGQLTRATELRRAAIAKATGESNEA